MARRLTSVLSQKTLILGGIALFAIFAAWVKAGVEITRPLIELTKDGEVISQHTSEVEAMERASEASGTYKLVRPDATIVVTDDCEVCPPVDPVDPNEPEDPNEPVEPPDPNEPVAFEPHDPYGLGWPAEKYPELHITYQPDLPGTFSKPGMCEDIHGAGAKRVTLKNRELLQDALNRLKLASGGAGGVLEIPWDVDTRQCDKFKNGDNKMVQKLTLRGVRGPNGEFPEFYCWATKLGGTVDQGGGGTFMLQGDNGDLLVENLMLTGYGTWFRSGRGGKNIYRNIYAHHATNDGNQVDSINGLSTQSVDIEYCGNEMSHGGQDNAQHLFYMHRATVPDRKITVTLLDNVFHSCNWSSCFKSTANENYLHNNRFYKTVPPADYQPTDPEHNLTTDPLYERKYGQMPVDLISCSKNVVEDNYFYNYRPEPRGYASGWMVAFQNRRGIHGCDQPKGYAGDNMGAVPLPDSEFWSPEYWESIEGTYPQKSFVTGNTFENRGPEAKSHAIASWGTYPIYASRSFGPACLLEAPEQWYERHKVYISGSTWIGFDEGSNGVKTEARIPTHDPSCEGAIPSTAHLRSTDYFEVL